jgi:hypothetical protein
MLNIGNGDSKDSWRTAAQTALHYSHFACRSLKKETANYSVRYAKVGLVPSLTEVGSSQVVV